MRILVAEDEKKVAGFIKKGFEEESYAVDVAYDGVEGEYLASTNDYDVIIMDIMLPKKNGIEVIKDLRTRDIKTPILLLTARDTIEDKVRGLDSGADDYLSKPFAFEELLARVRALLRRKDFGVTELKFADLVLDQATRKAKRGDKTIDLTSKEYGLLEYFLRNPNKVLTRTMIAEHVWDYTFDSDTNVIDVYVNHLRSKVDKDFPKKLIHTARGIGYILREEE
ncbi:MAG: DNA-binding response regulator [Deltaproteobacteria bacterium GWC2_42_51]|nr:MAG: DNA-binding response regulator [Deltaproteobacteria bacterium GWA2_42_85]OGP29919.1 MAG: DNA-binding response regulator [Deltaproteobacteria bacterium GWB2_42_7]OGP32882.1 MAG: DNA-binding response regulator [Deltaproteobacteria bacterium GWC2_42_51]OGP40711.1 MAG: DNA-binding response regulator [Deltaproteobacteria bacterium GWD2_42_10]OGP47274.1 MAG: DNA-binding response regulator [Deltaproteobacteria bacterium GWF2_42_12]OGQ25180.1 MAG: DNA-binding response regulator [Deltaproteobac